MPEKIGKYQVLERIGRGGMGMIFKAHDPILDRPVALKVISSDVEVTDDLRTRFLREAQACARLRHPHIVTIYDMGEDDGRLYIVMELLEGEELRHMISQRRTPPLEDKVSIMTQVCDGLHYAHQQGIVHRDIKPANIFLQRNGQVKLLDFGIAQMASTDAGLTKTGLIMGTLRYISPEQVRARADHRSDIYSLGAVFYELLSMRPPFTTEDPMVLLEQLRTEDPPSLAELDPSIPPGLVAITERALRKDPAERFHDLEEMRLALERVGRDLAEAARRAAAHAREQRVELLQLRTALAERVGASNQVEPIPDIDEPYRLTALQAIEQHFASRLDGLRALIAQADAWAPVFQRATELLDAGQFADAVDEFEAIATEMPEHVRAHDGLARARAGAESERHRQLAVKLTQDARSAFDAREYTLCLEILKHAAELQASPDVVQEIASLRATAESAAEAQDELRRARQRADNARARAAHAQAAAHSAADPRHALALWNEADGAWTEAEAALTRESYAEAEGHFDSAAVAYQRFESAAVEARHREEEAAQHASDQVAQARQRSEAEGAPRYAKDLWGAAEEKAADAHTALTAREVGRAIELLGEALALYTRAEENARHARARERQQAEDARAQAMQSRERAKTGGSPRYAAKEWDAVETRFAEAEQAFTREAYAQAGPAFAAAAETYRRLVEIAREARRRGRDAAQQAREHMAQVRQTTQTESSQSYVPALWEEAKAKAIQAETAFAREEYNEALGGFEEAARAFRRAADMAGEARQRERDIATQAREKAASGRERALSVAAPQHARSQWEAAEAQLGAAQSAFTAELLSRAAGLFTDALALYGRAEQAAVETLQRERRRAQDARSQAAEAQGVAASADAERLVASVWHVGAAKFAEGETAFANEQFRQAATSFSQARTLYQRAENEARQTRQQLRAQAELARQTMVAGRQAALAANAATHVPPNWEEAEASAEVGEAAFAQETYVEAQQTFERAAGLYRRAEQLAREVARASEAARADAAKARDAAAQARRGATEAQAGRYAADQWRAGESAEAQATAALERGEHPAARSLFTEARRHFASAGLAAGIAIEADTRRADAMVNDARALLASGDVAACLRRLNEVLTFRPDHGGAQQLRREAEGGAGRVAEPTPDVVRGDPREAEKARNASERVEADAAAALERQHDDATALFTQAESLHATAAEGTRVADATHSGEHIPIVGSQQHPPTAEPTNADTLPGGLATGTVEQHVLHDQTAGLPEPQDDPTTLLRRPTEIRRPTETSAPNLPVAGTPTAVVHAPPTIEIPPPNRAADVSQRESQSKAPTDRVVPHRQPERSGILRRRAIIGVVGAIAVAVLAVLIGKNWPTTEVWPPPDLQELAKKVVASREEASRAGAERSAKFAMARDKERAADAAFGRREGKPAEEQYREALSAYDAARTEVNSARDAARNAALTAQARADEARKRAEGAEASTRASSFWTKAEAARRKGESALEGRVFDGARTSFAEAEKTYEAAETEATGRRGKEERQKTVAAQAEARSARLEAEQARARGLAGDIFALAQLQESDGDAALESNPGAALPKFQEAVRLYKKAGQDAAVRRVGFWRTRAEQARGRMASAKRDAEQAAAGQRAPDIFDWGLRKDREAAKKFADKEYAAAEPLFLQARADYEIAVLEARKPVDGIPPPQLAAEQAQRRAVTYRERAVKSGVDRSFEVAFGMAGARERSAEKAMSLKGFKNARDVYGETGDLYLEVMQRAADRGEADSVQSEMVAAKQGANARSPEYKEAQAEEAEGLSAYKEQKYRDAVERFRIAQLLYARAATKTAGGSSPSRPAAR